MKDLIELLDISLLENEKLLKEIDHWLKVFNWTNGWHYDLDIIWIVNQLEKNNIMPGKTILDAGGGYGISQFLLAARGYNIISLDFAQRHSPEKAEGIFNIEIIENDLGSFESEYMKYMTYKSGNDFLNTLKSVPNAFLHPIKIIRYVNKINKELQSNLENRKERMRDHSKFGKIRFLRGTFNNIPLKDKEVDALISVSAFEHNTYKDMPGSIKEFNRVLNDSGIMYITTSAAREKDWYQEASKGWNFSKESLMNWFKISNENVCFDYDGKFKGITNSKKLSDRLGDYYKDKNNLTVPNGDLRNIQYIPVGIIKKKY